MRFATKFLIGSVATAIAAASHPDGLLVAGIAFSIWFVIAWFWSNRMRRSGRVIAPLLLVTIPWLIAGNLAEGAKSGAVHADGFMTYAVGSALAAPLLIYGAYIVILWILDLVFDMCFRVEQGLAKGEELKKGDSFVRHWWL